MPEVRDVLLAFLTLAGFLLIFIILGSAALLIFGVIMRFTATHLPEICP